MGKNIKYKKGQAQYFLESAFRIGFLMVALLAFFLLINLYVINKIDTNRLQAEVTADRIMYSDAIMYNENSRVYLGIVDAKKFNDDSLDKNVDYQIKRHATAKLELIDNINGDVKQIAYLGKLQYENLLVLAKSNGKGKGGATTYTKYYPVTFKDQEIYTYMTIRMTIIIPNS
jgi:hypothetical protein